MKSESGFIPANSEDWIKLRNFSLSYSSHPPLLEDVNIDLKAGNIYGIVGSSGSGKTSLLRHIGGLSSYYRLQSKGTSNIFVDFQRIAYVFQQTEKELNPIRKIKHHFTDAGIDVKASTFLDQLNEMGLEERLLDHYPFMNSGGQNQRFSWLLHWERDPLILLLDEPVSNVDPQLKGLLAKKIKSFVSQQNRLVCIATHQLDWIQSITQQIYQIEEKTLKRLTPKKNKAFLGFSSKPEESTLVKMEDISYSYKNGVPVIRNFNLDVRKNERIGITGSSGTGKSTLLHLLHGSLQQHHGEISWFSQNADGIRTALVGQNAYEELDPYYTIGTSLGAYEKKFQREPGRIMDLFKKFNLDSLILDQKPFELSGGQMQRVALIKSLLIQPQLLLLDESFSGLDDDSILKICATLVPYCTVRNISLMVVLHRIEILQIICHQILDFDQTNHLV